MKLVIFDFDGVLVNTLIMHYEISKEINENISLHQFRSLFNGNIYHTVANTPGIKQHPRFFERYEEEARELKVPADLKNLVIQLNKKYILTITSSTPSPLIEKILKQSKILEYFSDILGGDIHRSKVVKNKILLDKYKISPQNTVYITDSAGDVIEARECDIKSIGVTWGFQKEEMLKNANPALIIDNPQDLVGAIEDVLK